MGDNHTEHNMKRRRQRRRSGFLIGSGIALFFGTVIMDQRLLQVQVNQIVLSQLSPLQTQPLPQLTIPLLHQSSPPVTHTDNSSIPSKIQNGFTQYISDTINYLTTAILANESGNDHPTTTISESFALAKSSAHHSTVYHQSMDYYDNVADLYLQRMDRLPHWFQEYTKWHTESVRHLSMHRNYDDYQYVLLRCVKNDGKCYGTSDRLKMIPVILKLAYLSRRLFFIYWSRPFPLEEFLLPNTNYMNWTVPYYLHEPLDVEAVQPIWGLGYHQEYGMLDTESQSERVIRIISMTYASNYYDTHPIIRMMKTNDTNVAYNETEDELPMWDVYSDFWRALFVPSSGVRKKILTTLNDLDLLVLVERNDIQYIETTHTTNVSYNNTTQNSLQLIPNIEVKPYISVHVRANYTRDETENHPELNAIRCATLLQQQYKKNIEYADGSGNSSSSSTNPLPIYFASDTSIVTQRAIQYGLDHNLLVVSRDGHKSRGSNANPYHIDQPPPMTNKDFVLHPSDFYDTFVDLYLLAMGRCHSWGSGGYGSWASVIAPKEQSPSNPTSDDICPSIVHNKQAC